MANAMMIIIGGIGIDARVRAMEREQTIEFNRLGFIRDGDDAFGRDDELTMDLFALFVLYALFVLFAMFTVVALFASINASGLQLPFWEMRALFASLLPPPRWTLPERAPFTGKTFSSFPSFLSFLHRLRF